MLRFAPPSPPALLRVTAILALCAGVGVWASVLLAPRPGPLPPALANATVAPVVDLAPLARWFGAGPAIQVQLAASGVISAGARSVAVLAVDGARPRAYRPGDTLADGVTLRAVLPDGVELMQGGQVTRITLPALAPVDGIRAAPR